MDGSVIPIVVTFYIYYWCGWEVCAPTASDACLDKQTSFSLSYGDNIYPDFVSKTSATGSIFERAAPPEAVRPHLPPAPLANEVEITWSANGQTGDRWCRKLSWNKICQRELNVSLLKRIFMFMIINDDVIINPRLSQVAQLTSQKKRQILPVTSTSCVSDCNLVEPMKQQSALVMDFVCCVNWYVVF